MPPVSTPSPSLPDLREIVVRGKTLSLWEKLRDQRLFLTGGTGFFGRWLLEAIRHLNDAEDLGLRVTVLSRDPEAFWAKAPHFAERKDIGFLKGNVVDFPFPEGRFDLAIHAAAEASAKLNAEQPHVMLETLVAGTRRVLDFAARAGARRFLLTSSGGIYGPQPPGLARIPEDYAGAPDPLNPYFVYAEGKRTAELLCALAARQHGLDCLIARCFAFVGPYLPLDAHFAAGNFLRDALEERPIVIQGDGTALRSYVYATDLVVWLWAILLEGKPLRPYHVGSDQAVSIAELARRVADAAGSPHPVQVLGRPQGGPPQRYVPEVVRARQELGLEIAVPLDEALRRTVAYHRAAAAGPL